LSNPLIPQISHPEECGYSTLDSSNPDFASRVSSAPNIGCTCILSTIGLPLKSRDIDLNLRCLYLKRRHLKISYSNLLLAGIYYRSKYLFILPNSAILANILFL
jgi:hypothetical protein